MSHRVRLLAIAFAALAITAFTWSRLWYFDESLHIEGGELVAMRICGHAHHDDMLYLGKDPSPSWHYPELTESGYANREAWDYWSVRDPIATYAALLVSGQC